MRVQLYRGRAEWDAIARVKAAVSIPVVGNGDVKCGADAVALVERTGCDAVMIARAAEGNPWVFAQCKAALAGEPEPAKPSVEERIAMARRHARLLAEREGRNIVRMRKHAMWYMTGLPGAAAARAKINACVSVEDFDRRVRRAAGDCQLVLLIHRALVPPHFRAGGARAQTGPRALNNAIFDRVQGAADTAREPRPRGRAAYSSSIGRSAVCLMIPIGLSTCIFRSA